VSCDATQSQALSPYAEETRYHIFLYPHTICVDLATIPTKHIDLAITKSLDLTTIPTKSLDLATGSTNYKDLVTTLSSNTWQQSY